MIRLVELGFTISLRSDFGLIKICFSNSCHSFELRCLSHSFYWRSRWLACIWLGSFVVTWCNMDLKGFFSRYQMMLILRVENHTGFLDIRGIHTFFGNGPVFAWNLRHLSGIFLWDWIRMPEMQGLLVLTRYYCFSDAVSIAHTLKLDSILLN